MYKNHNGNALLKRCRLHEKPKAWQLLATVERLVINGRGRLSMRKLKRTESSGSRSRMIMNAETQLLLLLLQLRSLPLMAGSLTCEIIQRHITASFAHLVSQVACWQHQSTATN
jgi:hypothetical protein